MHIEAGQNHSAIVEPGDRFEQGGGRRHGRRRSCRNDGSIGRACPQPSGFLLHKRVTPRIWRHYMVFFQISGPVLRHDFQEFDRLLPVLGKLVGDKIVEFL